MEPYKPSPIDPMLHTRQASGAVAQEELANLLRGVQTQQAAMDSQAQLGMVGSGQAATAPNIFQVLGTGMQRARGRNALKDIEQQAKLLRGNVSEGKKAEMEAREAQRMRNYDFQMAQQAAREADARAQGKSVQKVDPQGNVRTVFEDGYRNAYVDGQPIEDYSKWRDAPRQTAGGRRRAFKPTGKQVTDYSESNRFLGVINNLRGRWDSMGEEARKELDSPMVDAAIDYLPPALQRIAEERYYGDEAQGYRSEGRGFEADLSKLMAGLQVTGFEMKDRQKWSPFAPGITAAERERRLDNMDIKLRMKQERYEMLFPDYTFQSVSGGSPPLNLPENIQTTGTEAPPMEFTEAELQMEADEIDAEIARIRKEMGM